MTPLWLALAAALLAVPAGGPARRVIALAANGRLAVATGVSGARLLAVPAAVVGVALPGAGLAAGALLGGPALGLAGVVVGLLVRRLGRRALLERQQRQSADDLVRAVRVLVGELDAGAGQASALASAAAVGGSCAEVFRAAAVASGQGGEASAVLLRGAGDSGSSGSVRSLGASSDLGAAGGLGLVGHAWRIGERSGAALVTVLERVAADLTAGAEQRRAAAVALAGPRSSALLLAGLPLLGIGLGVAMGADPLGFLLGPTAGRVVCATGVLLDAGGVAWMAGILRRARQP